MTKQKMTAIPQCELNGDRALFLQTFYVGNDEKTVPCFKDTLPDWADEIIKSMQKT